MMKELTDKLHLIKKRMLNMHQRVKHLKVCHFFYPLHIATLILNENDFLYRNVPTVY